MTEFIHSIPAWVEVISLAFCIGALVCRLWVFAPSARTGFPYHGSIFAGMWRSFAIAVAAMIAGSTADMLLHAAEISGHPIPAVFSMLPAVLFRTHYGRVWLIRLTALILLVITLKTGLRYRDSRRFLIFMLGITIIVSMTESASGHGSDAGDFSVPEIMSWLHLLAASVWGGGILVLSISVFPKLVGPDDQTAPLIAGIARRFSSISGIAIGIIAITALYNAWFYVGSFEALWKTPYGWAVIAKTCLFLLLISLIAVQILARFRRNQKKYPRALQFMRSVRVEAFIIAGVLFCAAFLRHEIPARHYSQVEHARVPAPDVSGKPAMGEPKIDFSTEKDFGEYRVTLTISPNNVKAGEETALRYVVEKNGKAVTDLGPYLGAAMRLAVVPADLKLFIHAHLATPGEPHTHLDHMLPANPQKGRP